MSDRSAEHSGASAFFVFGALRSGTTLMRLILKHHPELDSPGEADFLFDHIHRDATHPTGWRYDRAALEGDRIFRAKDVTLPEDLDGTDLMQAIVSAMAAKCDGQMCLNVHRHAPKLAALFPGARIIHLLRDPRDVARSSIGMGWAGNSYYGVDHWIGTERGWEAAAIPEDSVLTIQFEALMARLEPELTRICAYLGVGFEPAMLTYYENTTYGPPDPKIAQKWKKKAGAREIALLEGRIGPLLAARGYTPAGDPAQPGAAERVRLLAENRLKRWRHNIRRYGAGLFLGHHAARALRLKGLAARLDARQEAIRVENLQ